MADDASSATTENRHSLRVPSRRGLPDAELDALEQFVAYESLVLAGVLLPVV
ncbi:MAG: hypothetical protein O3A10_16205 [Chloroflexi bacterium]|nr:hypothetical protein [Chloroflexota bacterium]